MKQWNDVIIFLTNKLVQFLYRVFCWFVCLFVFSPDSRPPTVTFPVENVFLLHVKSMQLSLIFWQHYGTRSCLPCHLPYTLLVQLPNSLWFLQKYIKLDQKSWKSPPQESPPILRRVNPMAQVSCTLVSYPNLIALIPPNITYFVGRNEWNKVGVRDGGGAKRKRSTEFYELCC